MRKNDLFAKTLPRGSTQFGIDCMEKIRAILAHQKPPGTWWAHEVLAIAASGKPISFSAVEMAKSALKNQPSKPDRVPGEDDE